MHVVPITKPVGLTPKKSNSSFTYVKDHLEWKCIWSQDDRFFIIIKNNGRFFELTKSAMHVLLNDNSEIENQEICEEFIKLDRLGAFEPEDYKKIDLQEDIATITINLCQRCNLNCSYCFAGGGSYGGMEGDMNASILESIFKRLESSSRRNYNIILFGGEPLLRKDLVYKAFEKGEELQQKGINILFDIFTNGTLLDKPLLDYIIEHNNIRILLSWDGPPYINDLNRKFRSGLVTSGVLESLNEALMNIPTSRLLIRTTLTQSSPHVVDIAKYFVQSGYRNLVFDVANCDQHDIEKPERLIKGLIRELPEISDYLETQILMRKQVNINILSENIAQILMNYQNAASIYVGQCPAGRKYIALDRNADIYPCHYFLGNQEYQIGNFLESGFIPWRLYDENGVVSLRKDDLKCKNCTFRCLCEGACCYRQLVLKRGNGIIDTAFCEYIEARYIQSIKLLSRFYGKYEWPYVKMWQSMMRE